MTVHEIYDLVRQAGPEELDALVPELEGVTALAKARKAALPARSAAAPRDEAREPDYTVAEVAALLNLSSKKVYAACVQAKDPIPSFRNGGARRIPRKAFWAWKSKLEANRG